MFGPMLLGQQWGQQWVTPVVGVYLAHVLCQLCVKIGQTGCWPMFDSFFWGGEGSNMGSTMGQTSCWPMCDPCAGSTMGQPWVKHLLGTCADSFLVPALVKRGANYPLGQLFLLSLVYVEATLIQRSLEPTLNTIFC